jgi:predicted MFS family arabinose efflux permease
MANLSNTASARRAGGLLLLFTGLHVLNHVDRHLVASFAPQIMADLALSRAQFALIAGLAFSLVYAAAALGAGLLADRVGRVRVLTAGVGTWSLFTALSGLATGFWSLIAMRPFVAAGEASLVPTATTLLLQDTPERQRATAIGIFFMGIPLGVGASYLVAAQLGPLIGWRACFFLLGAVGLVATLFVSRVRDRSVPVETADRPSLAAVGAALARNPRLRWACLAIILLHAHMATTAFTQLWLVSDRGMESGDAARLYGGMFLIVGVAGAFGSGLLADRLAARFGLDHALILGFALLCLVPLLLAYRLAPTGSPLVLAGMAGSILFVTGCYGPAFAVIEAELPQALKASVTGLNMLLINVLMMGGLAVLIGAASDRLLAAGSAASWTIPLAAADLLSALGILCLFAAARARGLPAMNAARCLGSQV